MEHEQIINSFKVVINDSFIEAHKVRHNQAGYILSQIDEHIRKEINDTPFNYTETMMELINTIKLKRPGYVNQDIINILILGFNKQFSDDIGFSFHRDTLRKWFWEYGIKRDKETNWTIRNKWLRETNNYLNYEADMRRYDYDNSGIPFYELMNRPDAQTKYPFLYKFYIGEIDKEFKDETI